MTYGIVFFLFVVSTRYTCALNENITVGNSLCRVNHQCGYYGYKYKWCYTNSRNNWDYCCVNECKVRNSYTGNFYMCSRGNENVLCGGGGFRTVQGLSCVPNYECGLHNDIKYELYFWCYTDYKYNWDYCCHPNHKCEQHGKNYNWCYTGYDKGKHSNNYWEYCTPE